jgi:hypothetical protein
VLLYVGTLAGKHLGESAVLEPLRNFVAVFANADRSAELAPVEPGYCMPQFTHVPSLGAVDPVNTIQCDFFLRKQSRRAFIAQLLSFW